MTWPSNVADRSARPPLTLARFVSLLSRFFLARLLLLVQHSRLTYSTTHLLPPFPLDQAPAPASRSSLRFVSFTQRALRLRISQG